MQTQTNLLKAIRQCYLSGQFEKATEHCLNGLKSEPDHSDLHYLLALCDEKLGRTDEAFERLQRVVKQDAHHAEARFELGRLLAMRGQGKSARQAFNACLELDPGHAPARTIRARLDRIEGRRAEAVSGLKTALRADHDHVPALISLAEMMLEQDDLEAANQHASHAIQVAPQDPAAQMIMARVLIGKEQYGFAERCLTNAAQLDPENPHVYWAMASLLQRTGRHGEAVSAFRAALQRGLQDHRILRGLAQSLARLGRLEEARKVFDGLSPAESDRDLVLDLADLAAEARDVEALSSITQSAGALHEEIRQWLEALLCEARDDAEGGIQAAERLFESDDLDLKSRARLLAARLNHRLDRADQVAEALEPILAEDRLTHHAHWEMARLLRETEHFELAQASLEHVAARKDLSEDLRARTRSRLVDVLDRAGQYGSAAGLFKQAAWQSPYIGEPAYLEITPEHGRETLNAISGTDWPTVDEGAVTGFPVFVAGWPCTGRDLIIGALALSSSLHVMALADWKQRKQHLDLPVDPARFNESDASRLHLMRRRYLRGQPGSRRLLEPAAVQPLDLAQLARLFPGTLVINPTASENYLLMQWRLLGYRQVPSMLEAWRRDQAVLEVLRPHWPLTILDCPLEELLSDPAAVLADLSRTLGLSYDDSMQQMLTRIANLRGYRSPQHWKHYASAE